MASMIKTAAVTLAMNKCPFLSSEVLQIAAKSSAALYSMQARKCPVMGQLLTKGVATLPAPQGITDDPVKSAAVSTRLTDLDKPTQMKPALPLPHNYENLLKDKISTKKSDSTYREFRVLSRSAHNAPYAVAKTSNTSTHTMNKITSQPKDFNVIGTADLIHNDMSLTRTASLMKEDPGKKTFDGDDVRNTTPLNENVTLKKSLTENDVSVWCSNDYLGMSYHPRVTSAVVNAIHSHGVGAGGTRSIAGTSHYHVDLENTLADLHGKEAALVFTSCYVANDTALQTLANQLDAEIYSDAGNHASMIAGIKNSRAPKHVFRHNDVEHLEELLKKGDPDKRKIVAFESVYSMTGTMAPLERMCDVAHKHGAITFVDEVHAVGLYGYHGAGLAEELGIAHKVDILTGTLGKAYGLVGGYIASTGDLVDVVRSYGSGLIFTTSLPPSLAAGAVESVKVLAGSQGRELRLRHRAAHSFLRNSLIAEGFPVVDCSSHIVPVHIGDAQKAKLCMEMLFEKHKIYVQAINFPTVPRGSELLRFVATPNHSLDLIEHLMSALRDVWSVLDLPMMQQIRM